MHVILISVGEKKQKMVDNKEFLFSFHNKNDLYGSF